MIYVLQYMSLDTDDSTHYLGETERMSIECCCVDLLGHCDLVMDN